MANLASQQSAIPSRRGSWTVLEEPIRAQSGDKSGGETLAALGGPFNLQSIHDAAAETWFPPQFYIDTGEFGLLTWQTDAEPVSLCHCCYVFVRHSRCSRQLSM